MTSEIRTNSIKSRTGLSTVSYADTGIIVSGIVTATKFVGTIEPTDLTVSGDLTIPDKIIHSGDTNTSIRFPANDTITVETGGSEIVRIDSAGYVGINDDAAEVRFHVRETTGDGSSRTLAMFQKNHTSTSLSGNMASNGYPHALILENQDTSSDQGLSSLCFSKYTSGSQSQAVIAGISESAGNMALTFNTESSNSIGERLRITSAGRVGIGEDSPDGMLHIKGSVPAIFLEDTSGTHGQTIIEQNDDNFKIRCDAGNASSGNGSNIRFEVDASEKVRITPSGLGINITNPSDKLHVNGGDIIISTASAPNLRIVKADNSTGGNTTRAFFGIATGSNNFMNGSADPDLCIVGPEGGKMLFGFGNSTKFYISSTGVLYNQATYTNTTGNSANVSVPNSDGQFYRSVSSRKYKDNITTLTDALADKILDCRPVSYTSTCNADDKTKIFYGMIAEEVHEVDTSLVLYDNEPETPEPQGVQYDRFVPALINLVKRQKAQIETLEAKVATLEGS